MAISVEFVNLREVTAYMEAFPEETFKDAKEVFSKAVLDAQGRVTSNFGPKLQTRSGSLRRSIQTSVEGTNLESLDARIYGARYAGGNELVYTLTQEFGAEITAKNKYKNVPGGPYLNVPLAANKTPAGVMRLNMQTQVSQNFYPV